MTKFYSIIFNFDKDIPPLKHDRLVYIFYISREKREKLRYTCNSMIYLHDILHDEAECLSSVPVVKHFSRKNPRWRTAYTIERPVLQHHEISWFFDFQDGGCPPSCIFGIEIFDSCALQYGGSYRIVSYLNGVRWCAVVYRSEGAIW